MHFHSHQIVFTHCDLCQKLVLLLTIYQFDLFAVKSKKANKTNSSVRFLGEFMARQSAFEID